MVERRTRRQSHQATLDYRPASLRWPFLGFLLVYIAVLTAVLAYGCRILPVAEDRHAIPHDQNGGLPFFPLASNAKRSPLPVETKAPSFTPQRRKTEHPYYQPPASNRRFQKRDAVPGSNGTNFNATTGNANSSVASLNLTGVVGPAWFGPRLGFMNASVFNTTTSPAGNGTAPVNNGSVHARGAAHLPSSLFPAYGGPTLFVEFGNIVWQTSSLIGTENLAIQWFGEWHAGGILRYYATNLPVHPLEGRSATPFIHFYDDQYAGGPLRCAVQCYQAAMIFQERSCWEAWKTADLEVAHLERNRFSISAFTQYALEKCPQTPIPGAGPDSAPTATVAPALAGGLGPVTTVLMTTADALGVTTVGGVRSTFKTAVPVPVTLTLQPGESVLGEGGGQIMTLTDSSGHVTTARVPAGAVQTQAIMILRDSTGSPTATITTNELLVPVVRTLTDSDGHPTATVTDEESLRSTLVTLTDSDGNPTATVTEFIASPLVTSLMTLTDSNGNPTATLTQYLPSPTGPGGNSNFSFVPPDNPADGFYPVINSSYALGTIVPVLLSVLLSIFAQVIRADLKSLAPFSALIREGGASATDSLCLATRGWRGLYTPTYLLARFHEPLFFLGDVLDIASAILVTLSSEAIGLKLYGNCEPDAFSGCYLGLAIFKGPMIATLTILVCMMLVLLLMCWLLRDWQSGVVAPPGSLATLASLTLDPTTRALFQRMRPAEEEVHVDERQLAEELEGYVFSMRQSTRPGCEGQFGIFVLPNMRRRRAVRTQTMDKKRLGGFFAHPRAWEVIGRGVFLGLLCGVFIVVVYFAATEKDISDPFEAFMDSQSFGVHALFAGLGVVISYFWDNLYSRKSAHPSSSILKSRVRNNLSQAVGT